MIRYFYATILLALSSAGTLRAQDGGQLYELYCSACHGVDGKGAGEGTFPPLAGSEWLQGDARRAVLIVLKGLEGPIEVSGKAYNLAMPPHEASLSDQQILSIINYVTRAWGNEGEKLGRDFVRVTQDEYKDREKPWTGPELLKLFPLPKQETPLENVISRVYQGQWNRLPDFNKIEAKNVEEEHDGIIDISIAGLKQRFGIVWEGDFIAPSDGEYEFRGLADDGVRIILNDTTVAEINDLGPIADDRVAEGSVTLKKGKNTFRIEYFDGGRNTGLELSWRKSGSKKWKSLTKTKAASKKQKTIMLAPTGGKTVIYRNFIEGTSPRAIGFGFPGELNLVYSADRLAPELLWSGAFIDASRHWTNRGQGNQSPANKNVINLTSKRFLPEDAKFKGYTLDENGNPTFIVAIGSRTIRDSWKPGETGTLIRTLTLSGGSVALQVLLGETDLTESSSTTLHPDKPTEIIYRLK
ncbi:MAG: PA14 domain-containing protein [Luteolibacter sp.]